MTDVDDADRCPTCFAGPGEKHMHERCSECGAWLPGEEHDPNPLCSECGVVHPHGRHDLGLKRIEETGDRIDRARRELAGKVEGVDFTTEAYTDWADEFVPTIVRWKTGPKAGQVDDFRVGPRAPLPERTIRIYRRPATWAAPGSWGIDMVDEGGHIQGSFGAYTDLGEVERAIGLKFHRAADISYTDWEGRPTELTEVHTASGTLEDIGKLLDLAAAGRVRQAP